MSLARFRVPRMTPAIAAAAATAASTSMRAENFLPLLQPWDSDFSCADEEWLLPLPLPLPLPLDEPLPLDDPLPPEPPLPDSLPPDPLPPEEPLPPPPEDECEATQSWWGFPTGGQCGPTGQATEVQGVKATAKRVETVSEIGQGLNEASGR